MNKEFHALLPPNVISIILSFIAEPKYCVNTGKLRGYKFLGKRCGPWREWHKDSDDAFIVEKCYYIEGLLQGKFTSWYMNKNIHETGTYIDGKREGAWMEYYYLGGRAEKKYYRNDKLDGKVQVYDEDTGKVYITAHYCEGKRHGSRVENTFNGRKLYSMFDHGKLIFPKSSSTAVMDLSKVYLVE